jgi:hypothetical protein
MIIVPLDSSFDNRGSHQQSLEVSEIQRRANAAGLAGTVVPVWPSGHAMKFIAPRPWHPFFGSLSWQAVLGNVNKEINW